MEVAEPLFDLIEEEVAGQRQASREDDQLRVQHTAQIHAAHSQGFGRDVHAGSRYRVAGLRSVHNRFGSELLDGSQGGFRVGMLLQIVLRHQNQSIRRSVLLEAALLAASARRSIDLVNLHTHQAIYYSIRRGLARLPSRYLRELHGHSPRRQRRFQSQELKVIKRRRRSVDTNHHHVALSLSSADPAFGGTGGIRVVVKHRLELRVINQLYSHSRSLCDKVGKRNVIPRWEIRSLDHNSILNGKKLHKITSKSIVPGEPTPISLMSLHLSPASVTALAATSTSELTTPLSV